jgi:hypothetical protein
MTEEKFWQLISAFDWAQTGDDEAVTEPAVVELASLPIEEITDFQEILAQTLHALDTKAHARSIGEYAFTSEGDGFSVDLFLYARCCVVANGRDFFDSVVSDPSAMPSDMEFEWLLYVAASAYERKTGQEFDYDPTVSYETFANRVGWEGAT